MAMYMRRAIPFRNSIMFLRSYNSIIQTSKISHNLHCNSEIGETQIPPSFDFLKVSLRGFAKGKKSKDDYGGDTVQVAPDIGPSVKASAASQMDAAMVALSRELAKLRTGRASAGMLDHIIVETNSVKQPLNRIAVVSVMDPKTLSVNPYDPETVKSIEKAIVSSPLGLNPRVDGERLIASIPPLTKEHMQAMCKVVSKSCEDVKQSIRRARQKALDTIKKSGSSFSKDEIKRLEKEIDELTKKFVKSAEDICKAKEKEITEG
ncbi:hypothetical protein JCGZ_10154 [Jatropha curcas]|uniref:Ribosome-recycling factor, chloroplastic n=1 Tax=Jatropha curcas TaxID=180498 RepID=A0A067LP89_JATCU|nr:ribosome-recycling factor [Jatropha curcas]KDP46314.1 hypothetical protein JCGZ_10154 [Jatropha curcas]